MTPHAGCLPRSSVEQQRGIRFDSSGCLPRSSVEQQRGAGTMAPMLPPWLQSFGFSNVIFIIFMSRYFPYHLFGIEFGSEDGAPSRLDNVLSVSRAVLGA